MSLRSLPRYQQIYQELRSRIRTGELRPGDRVPTEEELSSLHGVSRMTARHALNCLVSEGLVRRQKRLGSFVQVQTVGPVLAVESSAENLRLRSSVVLSFLTEQAAPNVLAVLGLSPGAAVTRIERLNREGQDPISHDLTYVSVQVGGLLEGENMAEESICDVLERKLNLQVERVTCTIEAVAADSRRAALLGVPEGAPLLVAATTGHSEDGRILDYRIRAYRADRTRLVAESRAAGGMGTFRTVAPQPDTA